MGVIPRDSELNSNIILMGEQHNFGTYYHLGEEETILRCQIFPSMWIIDKNWRLYLDYWTTPLLFNTIRLLRPIFVPTRFISFERRLFYSVPFKSVKLSIDVERLFFYYVPFESSRCTFVLTRHVNLVIKLLYIFALEDPLHAFVTFWETYAL